MRIPKFIYVNWLPGKLHGMTIPPFGIFILSTKKCSQLLLHEGVHWKQYIRYGLILYYFRYFIQMIIFGYDNSPMELEARKHESYIRFYNYQTKKHWKK